MELDNHILKADWILPVSSPPIKNGAVVINNGNIIAVGPEQDIISGSPGKLIDYKNAVIAPAWVNAHTHLELSHLNYADRSEESFIGWVKSVVAASSAPRNDQLFATSVAITCRQIKESGTSLIGDITNGLLLDPLSEHTDFERVVFYEVVGFHEQTAKGLWKAAQEKQRTANQEIYISPHGVHSVARSVLAAIGAQGAPFSVHLAESREEIELIRSGTGPFRGFLEERKVWDEDWEIPGCSPVQYAHHLGLLNNNALLVHCVNVTEDDLNLIKANDATICLCPRSNANLKVGEPPLELIMSKNILFCVGTDSLASNTDLDVSLELLYLAEICKECDWSKLLCAGTLTGARALKKHHYFGSLEPGKKARLNIFLGDTHRPEEFIIKRQWSEVIHV